MHYNIWLLQIGEPLPIKDGARVMRTGLLAEKLVERGHNVVWWASCFDHVSKQWLIDHDEEVKISANYTIKLLKGIAYKKNISLKRFIDHRLIASKFEKYAKKATPPDIIVASYPSHDLVFKALNYSKRVGCPLIVDVRDQWPDIFLGYVNEKFRWCVKSLLRKDFYMSRKIFREADALASMMDILLNWATQSSGRKNTIDDKVFYIGAKPNACVEIPQRLSYIENIRKDKFIITFIGTFGKYYNPIIIAEITDYFVNKNVHFVIAGDGSYFDIVKDATCHCTNVSLPGWVNQNEISYLLSISNLGIIPCTSDIEAFPNKAFTYLSAGLPIVSSIGGSLKDILEREQIGLYYSPNDKDGLIKSINTMLDDTSLYVKMHNNVKNVFDEKYNANKIYEHFSDWIEHIVTQRKK